MNRLMIIPAAGLGSRLKSPVPKVLFPVNGRPMIDYLLDLYAPVVDCVILVLHPSFEQEVKRHCAKYERHIEYAYQSSPTGMLDAILIPHELVRKHQPAGIWITWCDQIAVKPETIVTLAELSNDHSDFALIFPTMSRKKPYIHFARNERNEIIEVLHQREGDELPAAGESDMGLFSLSRHAYLDLLPRFSRWNAKAAITQERNFLPFIPWLQKRAKIKTFSGKDEIESVGINTPDDLIVVEKYLRHEK
jgi:bifunctional UDP-N-acetylglucosamine pyrophosphorylase/glucosamine-1-phosphate N-acetyltransferase